MVILKKSDINDAYITELQGVPLIIFERADRIIKRLINANYEYIDVNRLLSKKLLEYRPVERYQYIESSFLEILPAKTSIVVRDFEMLFNPAYPIDIIKMFCGVARLSNVVILWPGKFESNKLIYGDPRDPDYHEYNCEEYQLHIVQ